VKTSLIPHTVALFLALTSSAALARFGPAPAPAPPPASQQAAGDLDARGRRAAADELAGLMERYYLFPDVARKYAEMLRKKAAAGNFDALGSLSEFASMLQSDMRAVHQDAHLRVTPATGQGSSITQAQRRVGDALQGASWIGDGVAYLAVAMLPGDESTAQRMGAFLDEYKGAKALVLDLRRCPGGTLNVMDVLFSRLYAERTHLLTMDMRADASAGLDSVFGALPTLERVDAPDGTRRWRHWAIPAAGQDAWHSTRVYVLTNATASACEHLTLALKRTGRATVVGATTRGAGHFGGDRTFAGGRLQVFLPVGRTYDPVTGEDWEGGGVTPNVAVAPENALDYVQRDLGTPLTLAPTAPVAQAGQLVAGNPPARRYGIGLIPPQAGETAIEVVSVDAGSIAERAGLRAGDRIESLNGTPVAKMSPTDLPSYMRASPLVLVIRRGGATQTITMSFGE